MISRIGLAAALLLALLVPATAHHGWGSYDASKLVTVEGKILTAQYGNPHVTLTVQGKEKTWTLILAPISRMHSRGAEQKLVAPGNTITAVGYVSTRDPDELRAERITIGGKTIEMR